MELYCEKCGKALNVNINRNLGKVEVIPCETCLHTEFEEGKKEGYDTGYQEGYDKRLEEEQAEKPE
jgi:hypothetical protein